MSSINSTDSPFSNWTLTTVSPNGNSSSWTIWTILPDRPLTEHEWAAIGFVGLFIVTAGPTLCVMHVWLHGGWAAWGRRNCSFFIRCLNRPNREDNGDIEMDVVNPPAVEGQAQAQAQGQARAVEPPRPLADPEENAPAPLININVPAVRVHNPSLWQRLAQWRRNIRNSETWVRYQARRHADHRFPSVEEREEVAPEREEVSEEREEVAPEREEVERADA